MREQCGTAHPHHQSLRAALLRHVDDAATPSLKRRYGQRLATERGGAKQRTLPPQKQVKDLGLAGTGKAGNPENLAFAEVELDPRQSSRCNAARAADDSIADFALTARISVVDVPAGHV